MGTITSITSKTLEELCAYKKQSKKVKKHITINGKNVKKCRKCHTGSNN